MAAQNLSFIETYAGPFAALGRQITTAFPARAYYGIGNSPAWLCEVIQIDAAAQGRKATTQTIPFSGKYCEPLAAEETRLFFKRTIFPSRDQIAAYRELLTQRGVTPKNIVARFENTGTKTLFFDVISSGNGAASFLSFLFPWAKEKQLTTRFKKAVDLLFVTLDARDENKVFVQGLVNHHANFLKIDADLAAALWREKDPDIRLVPSCPYERWGSPLAAPAFDPQALAAMRHALVCAAMPSCQPPAAPRKEAPVRGARTKPPFLPCAAPAHSLYAARA